MRAHSWWCDSSGGNVARMRVAAWVILVAACGPPPRPTEAPPDGDLGPPCTAGQTACDGSDRLVCVDGNFAVGEHCAELCDPAHGCVLCVPGSVECIDDTHTRTCAADGSTYTDEMCDAAQNLTCNGGICVDACATAAMAKSYIGCEYYPTVTTNAVDESAFQFAITISNGGTSNVTATIDGGGLTASISLVVAPGDVAVQTLPWISVLYFGSALVHGGAYHVTTTAPVTVYQFNPLQYVSGAEYSESNDASLLLPVAALDGDYVVASYPTNSFNAPGFLAVTATEDNTTVTITTRSNAQGGGGAPPFVAGVPQDVVLSRGDVLQLDGPVYDGGADDLTGSLVSANKPVQVISGHECTFVPLDTPYCDHIEETMFPIATLSTTYAVTNPAVPLLPDGKEQVIRIIAAQASTSLTFDPPLPAVATSLAAPGDFIDISRHLGDLVVTGDHRILVAQYMEGQEAGGNTGDPALALAVPLDQYRRSYLFHAPLNYEVAYVNLTAAVGTQVMVDGVPVTIGHPIGASGQGVERYQLVPTATGNHTATSTVHFGVSVYGYGQYTSYWYPGGLDLADIVIP